MTLLERFAARRVAVCFLLLLTLAPAFGQSLGATNDNKPNVIRNPNVSAPVYPRVIDVDLSELPKAKAWKPGDAIKEIPRKRTRNATEVKPEPQRDTLMDIQNSREAGQRALNTPAINIAGQGFTGVNPPDTVGDVGVNYYIQSINGSGGAVYTIYNKSDGSVAAGPFSMDALGSGNCGSGLGDPIILYDELAGRWMISEFSNSGNLMCVYVSQTGDPISGGWYNYSFAGQTFPDYPKYGIWPDAYYVGTNESATRLYAFDRNAMLNGQPATSQAFSVPDLSGFGFQMVIPADHDGDNAPPNGDPVVFMRHRDTEVHSGVTNNSGDYLEYWEFQVDWQNSSNTSLTGPILIEIAEIDSSLCGLTSFSCIPQPGTSTRLDPLREVVMNRLVYRNMGSYEVLVGNLATDVNGNDRAGIRWFELRKSGGGSWALHQEGTYAPNDGNSRWMGSIAMDGSGNIALGYNIGSSSTFPGLRYVGRLATDPLGVMTQAEQTIVNGTAANAANRYGDYASMNVDPVDDCTFWFTSQYNTASQWSTRIAAFRFDECGCEPPVAPTGVNAAINGTNQIDVSWNSVSGATSYNVYRGTGACGASLSLIGNVTGTSFSDTTVSGGITYSYVVRAVADSCESADSNCDAATATGACTTAPTFAGASDASSAQTATCGINVSWSAATANCGTGVSYNVYRSTTSGFTPSSGNRIASCVSGTTYLDSDVQNNTTYYYVVRAEDNTGSCGNGNEDNNSVEVAGAATGPNGLNFSDDFEGGGANFVVSGTGGSPWGLVTNQSTSPVTSAFVSDEASIKDQSVEMANDVALPAGAPALLQFSNFYNTEGGFDGGVLEYSTNGGTSWTDIGASRFTANGYNDTISTQFSSPIGGRQAWSGNSSGFLTTTVDLTDFAGSSIRFRWRMGCDSSVAATGWWIDDISITAGSDCTTGGPTCTYAINPTSTNVGSGGGSGSVTVTADSGCNWTATSNDAWITVTSGASGSGNGSVGYSVAANSSASGRSGTITIAGETFTVSQDGVSCSYSINPTSASAAAAGDSGSVSVTAPSGCNWTATSNAAWITVTSGASGSGNGSVGYSVAENTAQSTRSGTITIAGETFTVNQAAAPAGGWQTIDFSDFESGFQFWNDGGTDVRRSANDSQFAFGGTFCVRIRDNSGSASAMFTDEFDGTAYTQLRISFWYQGVSMETNENFFVEVFDGSSWNVVADFVVNQDFTNGTFENPTVNIAGSFLATNNRIRIRCDASGNGDRVYVDEVRIEGFQ